MPICLGAGTPPPTPDGCAEEKEEEEEEEEEELALCAEGEGMRIGAAVEILEEPEDPAADLKVRGADGRRNSADDDPAAAFSAVFRCFGNGFSEVVPASFILASTDLEEEEEDEDEEETGR